MSFNFSYTLDRLFRRLTSPLRRLPDFIIIGTSKGGTTSLYEYLRHHPKLELPQRKELQFYGTNYHKGIWWYRSHFPLKAFNRKKLTGEATPYYLYYPHAPALISKINPKARFIVLLRSPIDRAYSHFQMQVRNKVEQSLNFEDAIGKEKERIDEEKDKINSNVHYTSHNHLRYAYLERGKYGNQLQNWLKYFPKEQFLILKSEDFFTDPRKGLEQVYRFLDIPDYYPGSMKAENKGTYNSLDAKLRQKLEDYYKDDTKILRQLLPEEFKIDWYEHPIY